MLPVNRRDSSFNYQIKKPRSVKDLIEAISIRQPTTSTISFNATVVTKSTGRAATIPSNSF
ncbi:MAG: hypothetical protein GY806_06145 [Gammaproteobacteria bacterium]|nr:hypothetical protein [Gammaproteobacteria bacterium]